MSSTAPHQISTQNASNNATSMSSTSSNAASTLHKRPPDPSPPSGRQHSGSGGATGKLSRSRDKDREREKEDIHISKEKPTGNKLRKPSDTSSAAPVVGLSFEDDGTVVLGEPPKSKALSTQLPQNTSGPGPAPSSTRPPSRPEPIRQQSFSKRHASFDTPREVPLPFPFKDVIPSRNAQEAQVASSSKIHDPGSGTDQSGSEQHDDSPPSLSRNNSEPTPDPNPLAQRVDLRRGDSQRRAGVEERKDDSTDSTPSEGERERRMVRDVEKERSAPISSNHSSPVPDDAGASSASLPLPKPHHVEKYNQLPHKQPQDPPTGTTNSSDETVHAPPIPNSAFQDVSFARSSFPMASTQSRHVYVQDRDLGKMVDEGRNEPSPSSSMYSSLSQPSAWSRFSAVGRESIRSSMGEFLHPPKEPEITSVSPVHPLATQGGGGGASSGALANTLPYGSTHMGSSGSSPFPGTVAAQPVTSSLPAALITPANSQQRAEDSLPTMAVSTTTNAYILEAKLVGYQRDEITLSTRKKRILHVVADGFLSGLGHFERRVSFGYDADMSRVRAEFNGNNLKITVPRRPTHDNQAAVNDSLKRPRAENNVLFGTH